MDEMEFRKKVEEKLEDPEDKRLWQEVCAKYGGNGIEQLVKGFAEYAQSKLRELREEYEKAKKKFLEKFKG